jgi:hypothetical protein
MARTWITIPSTVAAGVTTYTNNKSGALKLLSVELDLGTTLGASKISVTRKTGTIHVVAAFTHATAEERFNKRSISELEGFILGPTEILTIASDAPVAQAGTAFLTFEPSDQM